MVRERKKDNWGRDTGLWVCVILGSRGGSSIQRIKIIRKDFLWEVFMQHQVGMDRVCLTGIRRKKIEAEKGGSLIRAMKPENKVLGRQSGDLGLESEGAVNMK